MLITVTAGFALVERGLASGPSEEREYPTLSDLLSAKKELRSRAMGRYLAAQRELVRQLSAVVHPQTGKTLPRESRGAACFLLGEMRTKDPGALEALVAAAGEYFQDIRLDIPYGISNPGDALIAIGKPAVEPVLDALSEVEGGDRLVALRNVLYGIEGYKCAVLRLRMRIEKESDPARKARLQAVIEYYSGLKATPSH
jgi:hypothetical protein